MLALSEIAFSKALMTKDTLISAHRGNDTFVIYSDWIVAITAPDNHVYELRQKNWNAIHLIDFMMKYPLERDDCSLMFFLEDGEDSVALEVNGFTVYSDAIGNEIEFSVV